MAISIGTPTQANPTPASSSYTLSHNMETGADGYLLCAFVMPTTVNFTGCTYDGQPMTLIRTDDMGSLSQRLAVYGIEAPSTGVNDVVVSFSGNQWNPTSCFAVGFTNAQAGGNTGHNGLGATPNSKDLTVSDGSAIYSFGVSIQAFTGIDIDGSARPLAFQHNTNRQVAGALSLAGLTAGDIPCVTKVSTGTVTNTRIEIKEAGGTPPAYIELKSVGRGIGRGIMNGVA